jgi:hypothetical protein
MGIPIIIDECGLATRISGMACWQAMMAAAGATIITTASAAATSLKRRFM